MWANYANNENGICLQYKTMIENNKEYINLYSSCPDKSPFDAKHQLNKHELIPVNYSENYPEIDFFTSLGGLPKKVIEEFWLTNYDQTRFSTCLDIYNDHNKWYWNYHKKAQEYICTKSKNWAYEEEQRVFLRELCYPAYDDIKNRIANYDIRELDSIIFGRKVKLEDKRKIINIIGQHCAKAGVKNFKFYDLYYSSITKDLELKLFYELT